MDVSDDDLGLSSLSLHNSLDGAVERYCDLESLHELLRVEAMLDDPHESLDSPARQQFHASSEATLAPVVLQPLREQVYNVSGLSRPALGPGGRIAVGTEGGEIILVASLYAAATESHSVRVPGPVTTLCFLPESEALCFGLAGGSMGVLARDSSPPQPTLQHLHSDDVRDIAGSGRTVATASYDGSVVVAELEHGGAVSRMALGTEPSSVQLEHHRCSVTTDVGVFVLRDLRTAQRHRRGDLTARPRADGSGALLVDHAWASEHEVVLAYRDGRMVAIDSRVVGQAPREPLWAVESENAAVENMAFRDDTFAVFGVGAQLLRYDDSAGCFPYVSSRYCPKYGRALGNAGAIRVADDAAAPGTKAIVTAPDGSITLIHAK